MLSNSKFKRLIKEQDIDIDKIRMTNRKNNMIRVPLFENLKIKIKNIKTDYKFHFSAILGCLACFFSIYYTAVLYDER